MAEHGRVEDGCLCIGHGRYRRVVVSGALTLRRSTVRLLSELLSAGGEVVFVGDLPAYVGGYPSPAVTELADRAGAKKIDLDELGASLAAEDICPIRADAGEKVFCQTRRVGEDYISVWLNCDRQNSAEFTLTA